jgi:chemotaxis protein MotA
MDIIGLLGLIIAFGGVIGGYILEGGTMGALLLVSPALIVIGGTAGVVLLSCNGADIAGAFNGIAKSFSGKEAEMPGQVIEKIVRISDVCRANGLLQIQTLLDDPAINDRDFLTLKVGMVMALDMKGVEDIRQELENDIDAFATQRQMQIAVFAGAGGFSPTLGIIGTVMGLVHVLGSMSDPESLVGSIGAAFIATLYGVGLANLVYLPLANRLKALLKREEMMRQMMCDGICMIVAGENSRSIENKLAVYYQAFPNGFEKYKAGISK